MNILGTSTYEHEFYLPVRMTQMSTGKPQSPELYPDEILNVNLMHETVEILQVREIYDLLSLLGDLGGINEILITILGILIFPISEFSYNLKAL